MFAVCTIRPLPHYRRDAFVTGLQRAGYVVTEKDAKPNDCRDLLVIWNRYGAFEDRANRWEADGGTVLVAENGYMGKDDQGRQYYALAIHGHNGSGWIPMHDDDRFAMLGIKLMPWVDRPQGYDLVCGQRGIGSRLMASPYNWHVQAIKRIPQPTNVRIRTHPGNLPATTTLESDLAGAQRCIIWSSSSGVKALIAGIPVWYDAPHWICSAGAYPLTGNRGAFMGDNPDEARLYAMTCMANGQYSVDELESGGPFATFRDSVGVATW